MGGDSPLDETVELAPVANPGPRSGGRGGSANGNGIRLLVATDTQVAPDGGGTTRGRPGVDGIKKRDGIGSNRELIAEANGGTQLGDDAAVCRLGIRRALAGGEDVEIAVRADDDRRVLGQEGCAGHEEMSDLPCAARDEIVTRRLRLGIHGAPCPEIGQPLDGSDHVETCFSRLSMGAC